MTPGVLRVEDPVRVMDGNKAAAYGVLLSRPDLLASYPISPQTPLLEQLYKFRAEGRLDTETVEVEGENSALSAAVGAVAAGGRAFTTLPSGARTSIGSISPAHAGTSSPSRQRKA